MLAIERTADLVEERKAFRADQFKLTGNVNAHFDHTGPEIWEQSGGSITGFCDFVGSGGTLSGVTQYLKKVSPSVKAYCIEPNGCAVLAGIDATDPNHRIQGGGYMISPLKIMQDTTDLLDGYLQVTDEE